MSAGGDKWAGGVEPVCGEKRKRELLEMQTDIKGWGLVCTF